MHEVADIDQLRAEASIDRRTDIAIAEIELGRVDLCLIALYGGLQLRYQRPLVVIALSRLITGPDELLIALQLELSPCQLRLVLLFGCLRLLQLRLIGTGIDLEQRVPGTDLLAFLEIDLDDLAVDPALDGDRVVRLDRADAVQKYGDILYGDGSGSDWYCLARRLRRCLM